MDAQKKNKKKKGGFFRRREPTAADLLQEDFRHTSTFRRDGRNPLKEERKRLKGRSVDWLMHDMRIPAIKADSRREIEEGKRQLVARQYAIQETLDAARGRLVHEKEVIARIDKEIAGYDEELQRLLALRK